MREPNRLTRWIAVGSIGAATMSAVACAREMHRAHERVLGRSDMVPSPYGDVEYAEGGSGPPVLVIHGSGGGYDQGELLARSVLGDGFRWIAPSRFGYLRSTFHEGATFDDQAHAYAFLLDRLGVQKAAVVALSHGGPSALLFAALHPERVASLTLISCGVASSSAQEQARADTRGDMLAAIFRHDAVYWTISKLFRRQLTRLMGADHAVVAGLTPEQRESIDLFIDYMHPVSVRSAGAAFDNEAAMPNERVAVIRAPTLILHAKDDTLQLYRNAEFAASVIPGAQLVTFDRGGHLLLSVEQPSIREMIHRHILGRPAAGQGPRNEITKQPTVAAERRARVSTPVA